MLYLWCVRAALWHCGEVMPHVIQHASTQCCSARTVSFCTVAMPHPWQPSRCFQPIENRTPRFFFFFFSVEVASVSQKRSRYVRLEFPLGPHCGTFHRWPNFETKYGSVKVHLNTAILSNPCCCSWAADFQFCLHTHLFWHVRKSDVCRLLQQHNNRALK